MNKENIAKDRSTLPYVYKWIHIPSGKWYIGSKIRDKWNPSRHEEYICSSKYVKPMICQNRSEWAFEILAIGTSDFIKNYETELLVKLDAKNNAMSFNQHNNDGVYSRFGVVESEETRYKKRQARLGSKNPMWGKKGKSSPHYGKSHSEETKKAQSNGLKSYCKNRPKSHNENISKSLTGNKNIVGRYAGSKNPNFLGWYVSPINEVFDSSRKAAKQYGVCKKTIVSWARNRKNGWTFIEK